MPEPEERKKNKVNKNNVLYKIQGCTMNYKVLSIVGMLLK